MDKAKLRQILCDNGLNDGESAVYIACLELGEKPVGIIARRAGLKRPTTYLVIERLEQMGLLVGRKSAKGMLFRAASPYVLFEQKKKACNALEDNLSALAMLGRNPHATPVVDAPW